MVGTHQVIPRRVRWQWKWQLRRQFACTGLRAGLGNLTIVDDDGCALSDLKGWN